MSPYKTLLDVQLQDATVHRATNARMSLEQIVVLLANEKAALMARALKLESIAPRKIVLPDGTVIVWRCPDHLIPKTD